MQAKKIIFLVMSFLIVVGGLIWMFGGDSPSSSKPIVLNIIGKTGASAGFFEDARLEFMKQNKNVEINYIGKGTFEAVEYIVDDNDVDGWICADETGADILKKDYEKAHPGEQIVSEISPIVTTPLVLVGWEERLNRLSNLDISKLYDMVSKGKSWGELGGESSWGFFNFSHTDAVDSNSGMQLITLLIHDYYSKAGNPKRDLSVQDVANGDVLNYIKAFEKNTARQADGSGKFMDMMVQFGPSKYDVGAIYEYYALSNIKNANGRWGKLKVIYPSPTIWSSRPFIIFKGKNITAEKTEALKKFRDLLLSEEMQKKAMLEGYRPANTSVSDLSYLEKEFSEYGFKKDVSYAVSSPTYEVIDSIRNLAQKVK